jgi:hypothetical protein
LFRRRAPPERLRPFSIKAVVPLWGSNTAQLAREFVERGFALSDCVDTTQLGAEMPVASSTLPFSLRCRGHRSVGGKAIPYLYAGPSSISHPTSHRRGVLRDDRFQYCDVMLDDRDSELV